MTDEQHVDMTDEEAVQLLALLVRYFELPEAPPPSHLTVADLAGDLIDSTPRTMVSAELVTSLHDLRLTTESRVHSVRV